jgi:hypothetical protein
MGNFLKSLDKGGPQFLATQTLLQTGNTFAETRLYNPLGTLIHTIPFVHTPRNIGKLPQIIQPIREFRGGLQSETLKKFGTLAGTMMPNTTTSLTRFVSGVTNAATSPFQALSSTPTLTKGFYPRPEDNVPVGIRTRQRTQDRGKAKDVGNPAVFDTTLNGNFDATLDVNLLKYKAQTSVGYSVIDGTRVSKRVFSRLESNATRYLETEFRYNYIDTGSSWDENISKLQNSELKSNIKDTYNIKTYEATQEDLNRLQSGSLVYGKISGEKDEKSDIIPFIFNSVDKSEPIHFRAFISSLKQSVKPEFNETRYVGRTERFVTYAGAKRTATLQFNVVAFSESELDAMWLRINYLTGLAFPKGVSTSGFMVPPLFRLTIGGIYDSQPCYIESLDFDLLDESITFDIDKHVSQVINVNMSITLLEKRSSFYDSPFYGISQAIQRNTLSDSGVLAAARRDTVTPRLTRLREFESTLVARGETSSVPVNRLPVVTQVKIPERSPIYTAQQQADLVNVLQQYEQQPTSPDPCLQISSDPSLQGECYEP